MSPATAFAEITVHDPAYTAGKSKVEKKNGQRLRLIKILTILSISLLLKSKVTLNKVCIFFAVNGFVSSSTETSSPQSCLSERLTSCLGFCIRQTRPFSKKNEFASDWDQILVLDLDLGDLKNPFLFVNCVFSSDPAVSSSVFVGAEREELISFLVVFVLRKKGSE